VFRFVEHERACFPVTTMCRVLGISPSGYWAWSQRPPSARQPHDAELIVRIGEIHRQSRGTYGVPRVHAELRYQGIGCSRKRVARLMAAVGLDRLS
jgi:putative transposase